MKLPRFYRFNGIPSDVDLRSSLDSGAVNILDWQLYKLT